MQADTMNAPSSPASIRYSGQCAENAAQASGSTALRAAEADCAVDARSGVLTVALFSAPFMGNLRVLIQDRREGDTLALEPRTKV